MFQSSDHIVCTVRIEIHLPNIVGLMVDVIPVNGLFNIRIGTKIGRISVLTIGAHTMEKFIFGTHSSHPFKCILISEIE